jgi:prepilin-type N-terminal cleavage/methylation domain-containing protein
MNQRGLTLLEVLIAITISTLIIGSAFWIVSGGLNARERIEGRQEASQDLMVLTGRLRAELSRAFLTDLTGSFQGEKNKLEFFYTTNTGLAQVEWESKEDGIYTKVKRPGALDWIGPFKLSGQWQAGFSYLGADGGWENSWQGKEKGLPQAVRVELIGKGKRHLTVALEAGRAIPY